MRRMPHFVTVILLSAAPNALGQAAPTRHMEYVPSHRASFEQTWVYTYPNHTSDRWITALRYPPELFWSKDVEGKAELKTAKGWIPFKETHEESSEHRKILFLDYPHNDDELRHGFTVKTTLTATICDQNLKKGKPGKNHTLSAERHKAFTQATDTFDFEKPNVKQWMDQHRMRIGRGEDHLDFVHRLYKELRTTLPYDTKDGGPWICSQILKAGFGECCRHAIVGTSVLRANKIPARTVCTLWAVDDKSQGAHCWGEFFLEGVGWVPYDTTIGDQPKTDAYFGKKKGEQIAGMIDFDWKIDAGPFGKQTVFAVDAFPVFWSEGKGNMDDGKVDSHTEVKILSRLR